VTTIEYALGEKTHAVIGIYDSQGVVIARIDDGVREAGSHAVEWNGKDSSGRAVASGVYFYRLEGIAGVAPRKMIILK
jgi:flagellar hook assembly protein FlgD